MPGGEPGGGRSPGEGAGTEELGGGGRSPGEGAGTEEMGRGSQRRRWTRLKEGEAAEGRGWNK